MANVDLKKSLQELEGQDWGEPNYDSHLVKACHSLRRKPLGQFTVEDLRIMIGQGISLPILIPLAIERLEHEPLAAGDLFEGDLLAAVANVEKGFWINRIDLFDRVRRVASRAKDAGYPFDDIKRLIR
jgi:hypothetical protein